MGHDDPCGPVPDAVRVDPDASYTRAGSAPPLTERERAVVSAQLGRAARGDNAAVHRCAFGLPTVVRVAPRLEDGTPFPTAFWLSCPLLRARVGTLESEGHMVEVNERLDADPAFQHAHAAAQRRYVAFRDALGGPLPGNPRAGGDERYVKCLHVHAAHALGTGDSPVGSATLERTLPLACPRPCVEPADADAWERRLAAGETGRPAERDAGDGP